MNAFARDHEYVSLLCSSPVHTLRYGTESLRREVIDYVTTTAFEEHVSLWEAAISLPVAGPSDFADRANYDPRIRDHLRVISDLTLRKQLISIGMAEFAEMRAGRKPNTAVIRLRPNLDARKRAKPRFTVEAGRCTIALIVAAESAIRAEYEAARSTRIEALKRDIADATDAELESIVTAIRSAMAEGEPPANQIRLLAFARVAQSASKRIAATIACISPITRGPLLTLDVPAAPAPKPMDPRRKAFHDEWDSRLLRVLTTTFQASSTIAKLVDAKNATVLERLNDMRKRHLVDRQIVKLGGWKRRSEFEPLAAS
jgi:hypothetical protein